MRGSVRKRGKTWSYRLDLGTVNGKRKQTEKGGFKTKKEAQQALASTLNQYNQTGKIFKYKKATFEQIYNNFIKNEAPITRKYSTIKRYESLYRNHLKIFDFRDMNTIQPNEIQEFITDKTTTHSIEFVRSIYNFLLVLFSYAERMGYINENIRNKVNPPKKNIAVNKDKEKVYSKEEIRTMYKRLESTNLQPAFKLGYSLGVRAGENYALRWSDFDFTNNTVTISKQLQYYDKRWCFTTLKTPNSYRTIVFGDFLKSYLLDLKKQQDLSKDFYKECYKKNIILDLTNKEKPKTIIINDFVNIKPNGEMLNTHSHKVISRIMKNEFNIDFKFHNLRHTHATNLLELGINPKYIKERLGHSKLEFSLQKYTHTTKNMHDNAKKIMDDNLEI